jgi:hypothetical protein
MPSSVERNEWKEERVRCAPKADRRQRRLVHPEFARPFCTCGSGSTSCLEAWLLSKNKPMIVLRDMTILAVTRCARCITSDDEQPCLQPKMPDESGHSRVAYRICRFIGPAHYTRPDMLVAWFLHMIAPRLAALEMHVVRVATFRVTRQTKMETRNDIEVGEGGVCLVGVGTRMLTDYFSFLVGAACVVNSRTLVRRRTQSIFALVIGVSVL